MLPSRLATGAAALIAVVVAGCSSNPAGSTDQYEYSSSEEFTYAVGDSVAITAGTFVGAVTVDQAAVDSVRIRVVRWADQEDDLDLLEVNASQAGAGIMVNATNPQDRDDVAVDIEITGPADALLDLATGVGPIMCSGDPRGRWQAASGVGNVNLAVPAGVNISVELTAGVGSVDVDFAVDGEIAGNRVVGTIGTGGEGEIVAHVGVGNISLRRR